MTTLIRKFKLLGNPYLLFSPFLFIYILIVLLLQTNTIFGDEARYYFLAQNLLHGFYSLPAPYIEFRNGPGYPLILAPFFGLNIPLVCIKLLNAVFLYFSVVLFFKTLRQFVSFRVTFIVSLFWACYYNAYEFLPLMYTETFTIFLISALMFCLTKTFHPVVLKKNDRYIYLSGLLLGYVALTKVIFGYVLILMLVGCLVLWFFKSKEVNYKRALVILIIALITTLPYLIYTYNLTGRVFYWSTVSGDNLYWMSSPYKNEFGDWFAIRGFDSDSVSANGYGSAKHDDRILDIKKRQFNVRDFKDSVYSNHWADFEEINKYHGAIAQDDALKRIAFKNITSHPIKYIENCISNIGRLFFNFPYSYKTQNPGTLIRLPMSGILAVLMLFCLIPTVSNWRRIAFAIRFLISITFIYLGGSVLACAETRMFTVVVPLLLLWITFVLTRTITINFKFSNDSGKK